MTDQEHPEQVPLEPKFPFSKEEFENKLVSRVFRLGGYIYGGTVYKTLLNNEPTKDFDVAIPGRNIDSLKSYLKDMGCTRVKLPPSFMHYASRHMSDDEKNYKMQCGSTLVDIVSTKVVDENIGSSFSALKLTERGIEHKVPYFSAHKEMDMIRNRRMCLYDHHRVPGKEFAYMEENRYKYDHCIGRSFAMEAVQRFHKWREELP